MMILMGIVRGWRSSEETETGTRSLLTDAITEVPVLIYIHYHMLMASFPKKKLWEQGDVHGEVYLDLSE
jgi:hypothetical protein